MTPAPPAPRWQRSPAQWALTAIVVVALAIDAVVHLRLAANYQLASSGGIGAGNLFRIAAVLAIGAAVFMLLRGSRVAYAVAFAVALSALAAVLLYRYVDVPPIGLLPSMYEPIWFFEKTLSAVAEAVGVVAAALGWLTTARDNHRLLPVRGGHSADRWLGIVPRSCRTSDSR